MRVLVTGGTGLVGEPVIRALLARGDSVVALVRSRESAEKATACGASPLLGTVEDPLDVASPGGGGGPPDHYARRDPTCPFSPLDHLPWPNPHL